MSNFIYSNTTDKGKQSFFLNNNGQEYYLFTQKFYRGVKNFFQNRQVINEALKVSNAHGDTALIRTIEKIPMYIRYIEREYGLIVLEKTAKHKMKTRKY